MWIWYSFEWTSSFSQNHPSRFKPWYLRPFQGQLTVQLVRLRIFLLQMSSHMHHVGKSASQKWMSYNKCYTPFLRTHELMTLNHSANWIPIAPYFHPNPSLSWHVLPNLLGQHAICNLWSHSTWPKMSFWQNLKSFLN